MSARPHARAARHQRRSSETHQHRLKLVVGRLVHEAHLWAQSATCEQRRRGCRCVWAPHLLLGLLHHLASQVPELVHGVETGVHSQQGKRLAGRERMTRHHSARLTRVCAAAQVGLRSRHPWSAAGWPPAPGRRPGGALFEVGVRGLAMATGGRPLLPCPAREHADAAGVRGR